MTQEEKQLLLKDICARLPYGITIYRYIDNRDIEFNAGEVYFFANFLEYSHGDLFKPYLRPMSSMTDEEREDWYRQSKVDYDCEFKPEPTLSLENCPLSVDWLNAHHFDYRGLIEKDLAIEAPEDMYE